MEYRYQETYCNALRDSSPAHIGSFRNVIDFVALQNTPVLAAADGEIFFVNDDSNIGGPYLVYWNATNFITVLHSNGEYSRCNHLEYRSAKVKGDQQVQAGQEIARVGIAMFCICISKYFYLQDTNSD